MDKTLLNVALPSFKLPEVCSYQEVYYSVEVHSDVDGSTVYSGERQRINPRQHARRVAILITSDVLQNDMMYDIIVTFNTKSQTVSTTIPFSECNTWCRLKSKQ